MALADDDLRHIHEALVGRIGAENADTFLDCLNVPRDWRRLIPGHPGTWPALLPEVRLRSLHEALVDWMGEETASGLMELLGVHEIWYRQQAPGPAAAS